MTSFAFELDMLDKPHPLKSAFLKWQCRIRQMSMRDNGGQPDGAVMPLLTLDGEAEPLGSIITVLNKSLSHSATSELDHMARKTNDPAQRRASAIQFFSAAYYQRHQEFSDILTSTFPPGSPGARQIANANRCVLTFEAYAQRFDLHCTVERLEQNGPLYRATTAHNFLFNPNLAFDAVVLGFKPDWQLSSASPEIGR